MTSPSLQHADARATIEILSDTQLRITRDFHAPRALVFEAMTRPEHVKRWYGPRALTMVLCEIDLQVGGKWRHVLRAPNGSEHGFSGTYQRIEAPALIVSTEYYEAIGPAHAFIANVRLEETNGRTRLTNTIEYKSKADRDGHIGAGMEAGMQETFERLAELLAALG